MSSIVKSIFILKDEAYSKILVRHRKKRELRKINNNVRMNILNSVHLTDEQKLEIDNLYLSKYGKKIPYFWHQYYTAYTGNFDASYFPELLFIPEFEYYMNAKKEYADVLADKNFLPYVAAFCDVSMPNALISSIDGMLQDNQKNTITIEEASNILNDKGEVFAKPSVDSGSGRGCCIISIKNGIDIISGQNLEELFNKLGSNFIIQKKIKCHESISSINPYSVNTFRIITYRWKNDIKIMPAIMRIGTNKSFLDNAHAGGIFIAVDDDGCLHDTAFTEFNKQYKYHPDTNVKFSECRIEGFPLVIEKAKKLHSCIPQLGVINWDFTINENGKPVLIEANTEGGSIWLIEMAHGRSGFKEDTAEILEWLKFMNGISSASRHVHNFGRI